MLANDRYYIMENSRRYNQECLEQEQFERDFESYYDRVGDAILSGIKNEDKNTNKYFWLSDTSFRLPEKVWSSIVEDYGFNEGVKPSEFVEWCIMERRDFGEICREAINYKKPETVCKHRLHVAKVQGLKSDNNNGNDGNKESKTCQVHRTNLKEMISGLNGSIFSVTLIKKNGTVREMNCRNGVKKHLRGGTNNVVSIERPYITVFDLINQGYRTINLGTVQVVKANQKVYEVIG